MEMRRTMTKDEMVVQVHYALAAKEAKMETPAEGWADNAVVQCTQAWSLGFTCPPDRKRLAAECVEAALSYTAPDDPTVRVVADPDRVYRWFERGFHGLPEELRQQMLSRVVADAQVARACANRVAMR